MICRASGFPLIVFLVIGISVPLAYLISRRLQHQLLHPILALAETTRAVSTPRLHRPRGPTRPPYEFDLFPDTFNHAHADSAVRRHCHAQLGRLSLLPLTRATGERQDLPTSFQVVLGSLVGESAGRFGCLHCCTTPPRRADRRRDRRRQAEGFADKLAGRNVWMSIDANGLSRWRCVAAGLANLDVLQVPFPFRKKKSGWLPPVCVGGDSRR